MPLFLKSEPTQTLPGLTLYSDPLLGRWVKPTGVYLPPSVDIDTGVVNVLIWLHGWYVKSIEQLFTSDRSAVRRQVLSSGKSVVLVAPYLGEGFDGKGSTFSVRDLTGRRGELFLNQVLGSLALMRDPDTYEPPWKRSDLSLEGLAQATDPSPGLRLGKLVIACHSGGGAGMRNLVGALGRYKGKLTECWGFDCLYGVKIEPDDASFWFDWATGSDGRPLFVSYGKSTMPQSVKLDLMGRGLATREGLKRDPKGPEAPRLTAKLGISTARPLDDLMGLKELLAAPAPKRPPEPGSRFADQAASNLARNAGWPKDSKASMEMHYQIARDGLLERLKGAGFL